MSIVYFGGSQKPAIGLLILENLINYFCFSIQAIYKSTTYSRPVSLKSPQHLEANVVNKLQNKPVLLELLLFILNLFILFHLSLRFYWPHDEILFFMETTK